MARIVIDEVWYDQVEPSTFSEKEFEDRIILHAPRIYSEYFVIPYKIAVESDYGKSIPDLVFISKTYDEWIIVEVEMGYHPLASHVEPQVQVFANGVYGSDAASYIIKNTNNLDPSQISRLVENEQPKVQVIVNVRKPSWSKQLARYGATVATLELYRSEDYEEVFLVNGDYPFFLAENISDCSFHPHIPRFLEVRDPDHLNLPIDGRIKLRFNNCITEWLRVNADGKVWLKPVSRSPLNDKHHYQIYRQRDHALVLHRIAK